MDCCPSFRFCWRGVLVGSLLLLVLNGGVGQQQSHAQSKPSVTARPLAYDVPYSEWKDCGLRKGSVDAFVTHQPDQAKQLPKSASIEVQYAPNFPMVARAAFERAVRIWETRIDTDTEIRIEAGAIADPGEGTLGGTFPTQLWILQDEDGPQLIAGDALADVLTGQDVAPDSSDMVTDFNFERNDWHFGSEPAPSGTVDFTSVALHEIAHGLNYLSLCNVSLGRGQCRFEVGGGTRVPDAFSTQLREQLPDGRLLDVTDEDDYSSSDRLADALTSDRVVFVGQQSEAAAQQSTGPVPPKVYAPGTFQGGSSLSHVEEDTYPFEGTNALMTPFIAPAETNRLPGPIVCGQLADIGWTLGRDCEQYFQDVFNFQFAEQTDTGAETVTLDWRQRDQADIEEFIIEQRYFNGTYDVVRRGVNAPPVTLDSLGLGKFAFRVRWIRSDGTQGLSVRELERTVPLENVSAEVVGQGEQGRGNVDVTWQLPPGTPSTFSFQVERSKGDGLNFQEMGTVSGQRFSVERQPPGIYFYRVVAQDQEQNTLVSSEAPVRISFDGPVYVNGPFPNPVQDQATVILTARQFQDTTVEVFNSIGERVYRKKRVLGRQEPTRFQFNTRNWSSGLYFLRVQGRAFTTTRKMMVVH